MTDAPKRVQLSRARGWRLPEGAVVVSRPSPWGNPIKVGSWCEADGIMGNGVVYPPVPIQVTAEIAVSSYRRDLEARLWEPDDDALAEDRASWQRLVDGLAELRGRDLACWCPTDRPCHADVLLDLANRQGQGKVDGD